MVCLSSDTQDDGTVCTRGDRSKRLQRKLLTSWLFNCRCSACSGSVDGDDDSESDESPVEAFDELQISSAKASQVERVRGKFQVNFPRCSVLGQISCKENIEAEPSDGIVYPCISSLQQLVTMVTDRMAELYSSGKFDVFLLKEDLLIRSMLDHFAADYHEFSKYALFEPNKLYSRNLVASSQHFDLIMLCWNPGKRSPIHDHSGAHCHMKVLEGEIFEDLYDHAGRDQPPQLRRRSRMPKGYVGYIDDTLGLHAVGNASPAAPAISLHLYHPPIRSCLAYSEDGAAVRRDTCFHSIYGELVSRGDA